MHLPWAKKCTCCGKLYKWLEWVALAWVGTLDHCDAVIELRNCICGSTISIRHTQEGPHVEMAG